MAALTGSGSPPGPTSVWAAMSPSRGSASNTSAAVASAPGSHQESSSLNATYGVWARRTPALRAAAPALRASATTSTPGKPWAAASALPSADPLSTTITGGRSGSRVSMPSVRSSSPRRLRVATTTVTRLTGHAIRLLCAVRPASNFCTVQAWLCGAAGPGAHPGRHQTHRGRRPLRLSPPAGPVQREDPRLARQRPPTERPRACGSRAVREIQVAIKDRLSYLTLWPQRSSSQARLPGGARSLGADGLQAAGQVQ